MDNMLVKDYISDALFKLMEKEPYANINITKLVKEAGVCRKSFYRNYNSMEEILIKKIESITDEFVIKSNLTNYKNNFKRWFYKRSRTRDFYYRFSKIYK